MNIAIQTMFLPRQNILYLEEWLLYHTFLGFDNFYLYDNTGSENKKYGSGHTYNYFDDSKDRYGNQIISKNISDELIKKYLMKILNKFKVTIIKWPSKNY